MSRRLALSSEYVDALVASDVSACALRVALLIARMQGRNEHAWPSVRSICERVGAGERAVQGAIRQLSSAGLLTTFERTGKRTFYTICTPAGFAAPGGLDTGAFDAGGTGAVSIQAPPQETPPGGAVSIHSHLIQEDDQRSLIKGKESPPTSATADGLSLLMEPCRKSFADAFVASGKTLAPWMVGFGTADWAELTRWLSTIAPGREPATAAQLATGFARNRYAESRGFRFRGPGGLIEGPGEFLALGGQVAPSVVKHSETSDVEFEKALGGT